VVGNTALRRIDTRAPAHPRRHEATYRTSGV
jgi:hypothetical protein